MHVGVAAWLEQVHVRHQVDVRIAKGHAQCLLHVGPVAVVADDRQLRERPGDLGQAFGVVEGGVRGGRPAHQKQGNAPCLQMLVDRPVQRVIRLPGRFAKPRLQVDTGQAQRRNGTFDLAQRALDALQRRVDTGDAEQLIVVAHDAVNQVVGKMLAGGVTTDHHRPTQPGIADLIEKPLGCARAGEVFVVPARAHPPVQPPGGGGLGAVWGGAEKIVQVRRAAAHINHVHAVASSLVDVLPARTSNAPPVSTWSRTVTGCLPNSGNTSSAKRKASSRWG